MNVGTVELECWFLTGSQHLYGEETLREVAAQSAEVVAALDAAPEIPVKIVPKPVLTGSDEIRQVCLAANASPNCIGVIAWMHTFSPAKAWIAGLEHCSKPLLHLHTQANRSLPWGTIDMDFMNLNQSAHGDREFGYIAARLGIRRKVVAGHVSDAATRNASACWTVRRGWVARVPTTCGSRGSGTTCVTSRSRKATVSRRSVHSAGRSSRTRDQRPRRGQFRPHLEARSTSCRRIRTRLCSVAPELRADGQRHESSARRGAGSKPGCERSSADSDFQAFTTNFQDLGWPQAASRDRPAAADGRRLRIRRRRRLEDRRPASSAQGRWDTGGPAEPRSWRTTPTISVPVSP